MAGIFGSVGANKANAAERIIRITTPLLSLLKNKNFIIKEIKIMKEIKSKEENMLAENTMRNARELWDKKLAEVPVELMCLDMSYQRIISNNVKKLMRNWNPNECRFLLASYRDGKFYILDGQHRWEVAKAKGLTHLPCEIFVGLNREEEARIFATQNENITKLTPYDTFKANLACGDIKYVDVQIDIDLKQVCDSHGVIVSKGKAGKTLKSVTRGRNIVSMIGKEGLDWVFSTIENVHWCEFSESYASTVLDLFKQIYSSYKGNMKLVESRLIPFLASSSPKEIMAIARVEHPNLKTSTGLKLICDEVCNGNKTTKEKISKLRSA